MDIEAIILLSVVCLVAIENVNLAFLVRIVSTNCIPVFLVTDIIIA